MGILLLITLCIGAVRVLNPDSPTNLLAYVVTTQDHSQSLMVYDPRYDARISILSDVDFLTFAFSVDGRIAYQSGGTGNAEIYVMDLRLTNPEPIMITHSDGWSKNPLAWSQNGRYLAFGAYEIEGGDQERMFVWDGTTAINVTPDVSDAMIGSRAVWNNSDNLAFRVGHRQSISTSEIYVWDGDKTYNVSQSPNYHNVSPAWSPDGRLAFLQNRYEDSRLMVWDGKSFNDGLPDTDTFTIINLIADGGTRPTWTADNRLSYNDRRSRSYISRYQNYVWDGEIVTNISMNSGDHTGPRWNVNGDQAFTTLYGAQQTLHVRDANNYDLLTTKGFSPAIWSSDANLMYCVPAWALTIWNGKHIVEVARGNTIWAQWQGGDSVFCSSG